MKTTMPTDTVLLEAVTQQTETYPLEKYELLASRPTNVAETGLALHFLQNLTAKHLTSGGVMDLQTLSNRIALAGPVLQEVLETMRADAWVEVRGPTIDTSNLRYALTDKGRAAASEALLKSGYIGAAPVTLARYIQIVQAQSIHLSPVTQQSMQKTFSNVVARQGILDQLGCAQNSGRAIFIYGPPGTGKSYLSQKLAWIHNEPVLIPHAIEIDGNVIQVFDPSLHHPTHYLSHKADMLLNNGFDPRFVLCRRPAIITGGELTADMLEIQSDQASRCYHAPLQLKANNGVYIIDDLGRQKVAPVDLLNRWIVPMESKQDFLYLASGGTRMSIPFDVVLIFSTNMEPSELADEAFLRRLGHKIYFPTLNHDEYRRIWKQVCDENEIQYKPALVEFVIRELHDRYKIPLLPCHPKDLLGMAIDYCVYKGIQDLTPEILTIAWNNYFVNLHAHNVAA